MIHIETVDLSLRNIALPSDRVGMVIAQPFLSHQYFTTTEPYQCTAQAKQQQLEVLAETLSVARIAGHGVQKTHFTIFPEYSIPGHEGIELVETLMREATWPNGTVVIGGTDALTQAQYTQLLQSEATYVDAARNGAGLVGGAEWVNCAVIWVKGSDGKLERWIQPKLHPAWEEMDISYQHMFRGRSVYLFKGFLENGAPYRFGTLVCFDWIATVETQKTCRWILSHVQQEAIPGQLPLSWLFIIQHNKKPSHETFLNEVGAFFNQTEFPNALRDRACLVFANTAGKAAPGRTNEFGGCSVVLSHQSGFSKPECLPTFSNGGSRFRDGSNLLSNYKDIFFRERGACIHSFAQINPGSLIAGPAGRVFAAENAHVFPVSGAPEPRAPAAAVAACVKWLNDELDQSPSLSIKYHTAPLAAQVDTAHHLNIAALRVLPPQTIGRAVQLAAQESQTDSADDWSDIESSAITHLVHTLDIIGVGFPSPIVGSDSPHATFMINNKAIDLLAVRGSSHEECIEHSKRYVSSPQRQVLLVSRDEDNTAWRQRFGSYLQPKVPQLGQERNITDPASGSLHLGYERLLNIFRASTTAAAIMGAISAELAA